MSILLWKIYLTAGLTVILSCVATWMIGDKPQGWARLGPIIGFYGGLIVLIGCAFVGIWIA